MNHQGWGWVSQQSKKPWVQTLQKRSRVGRREIKGDSGLSQYLTDLKFRREKGIRNRGKPHGRNSKIPDRLKRMSHSININKPTAPRQPGNPWRNSRPTRQQWNCQEAACRPMGSGSGGARAAAWQPAAFRACKHPLGFSSIPSATPHSPSWSALPKASPRFLQGRCHGDDVRAQAALNETSLLDSCSLQDKCPN